MPSVPKVVRDNIKHWMKIRGMNQTRLAEAVGELEGFDSQAFVSQILNGRRDCNTNQIEKIADALNVPIERLWFPRWLRTPKEASTPACDPMLAQHLAELNQEGVRRLIEQAEFLVRSGRFARRVNDDDADANPAGKGG